MLKWSLALWMFLVIGHPVIACAPPNQSNILPKKTLTIPVVHNRETLMQSLGQNVQLKGRYVAKKQVPDITSAGIWNPDQPPMPHIRATIVLMDGTAVALYPPTHKQSLRSPTEADQFDQHTVIVDGKLEPQSSSDASPKFVISPRNIQRVFP